MTPRTRLAFPHPLSLLVGSVLVAAALPPSLTAQEPEAVYRARREALVRTWVEPDGITDSATLRAMRTVLRHRFVAPELRYLAYEDGPLPIGYGATISQPYIVALMTQAVRARPGTRVLEVGTGSGYQAAVLAEIGCRVWTIELVAELATSARRRLRELGYAAVEVRHGDGYRGWPEEAPFDAILVTAAADSVPPALLAQLAPGGRLVMPVGPSEGLQHLLLVEKDPDGSRRERRLAPVRFVPLIRP